jgi:hypothetical protein
MVNRGHSMIKFENKTNKRYYYINIEKDIFGDTVLHITRGGVNCSVSRLIYCPDPHACRVQIDRISKTRLRRGYTLIP